MATYRLLIVDDSAPDRALYRRYLTRPIGPDTFELSEAATGAEALAQFRAAPPDCVLLDYYLPDVEGLALLTKLRTLAPPDTLCVVMVTGLSSTRVAVDTLTGGAIDYLVKQEFNEELLYKTLVHAIEKCAARWHQLAHHQQVRAMNDELQQSLKELTAVREQLAVSNQELVAANGAIQAQNDALAATNRQLVSINADLDTFVYTASHDLRAPIVNLEGLFQALAEELPAAVVGGAEVAALFTMMAGAVERFKRTIDDLTEIVKLQKMLQQPAARVELATLIRDVALDLGPLVQAAGATLTVALDECPAVSFAEKNLRSIVYNLLSNALKYRAPARPAQVLIRCGRVPDAVVLTVQDNGTGLAPAAEQRMFEMFSRFHPHIEGSGIGLHMVKKIVDNAGGRIEVESRLDVGTTFRVYLPQAAGA